MREAIIIKSTFLFVMSIICIVIAALAAIAIIPASIAIFSNLNAITAMNEIPGLGPLIIVSAIISLISFAIMLISGIIGIGASKDITKAVTALKMGIIMIVIAGAGIVIAVLTNTFAWNNLTALVIPILYSIAAQLFIRRGKTA